MIWMIRSIINIKKKLVKMLISLMNHWLIKIIIKNKIYFNIKQIMLILKLKNMECFRIILNKQEKIYMAPLFFLQMELMKLVGL